LLLHNPAGGWITSFIHPILIHSEVQNLHIFRGDGGYLWDSYSRLRYVNCLLLAACYYKCRSGKETDLPYWNYNTASG
jgi:hypothetical protein